MNYGDAEHAADVTQGRHPGIRDGLQWLTYAHLPSPLQKYSSVFYEAATELLTRITSDSPELTTAINRLIEAKDSAMRAGIRHDTGRAGSVPRPQEVVAPPKLTHDDGTMGKVRDALRAVGLPDHVVTDAIQGMQNRGVLFREQDAVS